MLPFYEPGRFQIGEVAAAGHAGIGRRAPQRACFNALSAARRIDMRQAQARRRRIAALPQRKCCADELGIAARQCEELRAAALISPGRILAEHRGKLAARKFERRLIDRCLPLRRLQDVGRHGARGTREALRAFKRRPALPLRRHRGVEFRDRGRDILMGENDAETRSFWRMRDRLGLDRDDAHFLHLFRLERDALGFLGSWRARHRGRVRDCGSFVAAAQERGIPAQDHQPHQGTAPPHRSLFRIHRVGFQVSFCGGGFGVVGALQPPPSALHRLTSACKRASLYCTSWSRAR